MKQLRLLLPPCAGLAPDAPVQYAVLDKAGCLLETGVQPLNALPRRGLAVAALLAPQDVTLTQLSVPPLNGARLSRAVATAVEPLALSDPAQIVLAHERRTHEGQLSAAWMDRPAHEHLLRTLQACGLAAARLYPPHAFMRPVLHAWTAWQCGNDLVVRTGLGSGFVQPLAGRSEADHALLMALVQQGRPALLHWVGGAPAWWQPDQKTETALPEPARWTGPLPDWSLPGAGSLRSARGPWLAAAASAALGLAAWVVGLNLHAVQLAREGAALKAATARSVQQAFPGIGVVRDPLLQARQQRDARLTARREQAEAGPAGALRQLAAALALESGDLSALEYDAQGWRLALRREPAVPEWRERLRQAGLQLEPTQGIWVLRPGAAP